MTLKERRSIQTYSGKAFHYTHLRKKLSCICIEDIAHALSLINRFTGHTRIPYSVAEHSVRMSLLKGTGKSSFQLGDPLTLLMHDAHEAYLSDCNSNLKALSCITIPKENGSYLGIWKRRKFEDIVQEQIVKSLGITVEHSSSIKRADELMLVTEFRDLFDHPMLPIWGTYRYIKPLKIKIVPWSWQVAEKKFLARYKELTK